MVHMTGLPAFSRMGLGLVPFWLAILPVTALDLHVAVDGNDAWTGKLERPDPQGHDVIWPDGSPPGMSRTRE
jgi:hypothetical protein